MTTLHIIITAFVALALWWLLKDYPTWRQQQLQMAQQHNKTTTDSTQQKPLSLLTQQQQGLPPGDSDNEQRIPDHSTEKSPPQQFAPGEPSNDKTADSTTNNPPGKTPSLNLAQYTLMIPMAVVYLIGRTVVDVTRGCLFHLLYKTELAAPAIDAWLFDKVTVWIPKKYDQVEAWWITRGRHIFEQWQHTLIYVTIPTAIDYIDAFFLHVYNGSQLLMETIHKIGDSFRLFREKHDWRQLAIDIGNIGYTLFWQPFISVVTRLYGLGKLFCQGCWYGLKATWGDLRWVAIVGLPLVLDRIMATSEWAWIKQVWYRCQSIAQTVATQVVFVTSPVLHWFGRCMVRIADALRAWCQSEWVQGIWRRIRFAFINSVVWVSGELVILVRSIKIMAVTMVDNGLVPILQLFMNHVMPRLANGYQRFLAETYIVYQIYVQPIGQRCIEWCSKALLPLFHIVEGCYQAFLSYLSKWNWDGVLRVSAMISHLLQSMMGWLLGSLGPAINNMVSTMVSHHVPLTVRYINYVWKNIVNDLDTSAIVSVIEQLYQVIQEQCSLLFASLERTMKEWQEAQQESDTRPDKTKATKIS